MALVRKVSNAAADLSGLSQAFLDANGQPIEGAKVTFLLVGEDGRAINTIDVPNLDEYIAKVKSNGGDIVVEKMKVPGVGYLVYAKDVEGTVFGMLQPDASNGQ